jgi:2-keto-4-pentenoate hydratase/2-oxohepta-3-ene-1,7-dioic acid hydratase in catechol pathway
MKFPEESFRKKVIKTIDDELVPVGMIYCIGRNYMKHIEEMNSRNLGEPVIFTKPASAVCQDLECIPIPSQSQDVHHEIELALVIGKQGKGIPREEAQDYIAGSAVALDLTMRDLQANAKKNGTPWALSKGFDYSCPISRIYPETDIDSLSNIQLFLEKNGHTVQHGHTKNMLFTIDYLISYLSRFFTLQPGDIILTGTPEGVGPIVKGDRLTFHSTLTEPVTLSFL